eukprot:366566-Chlamydomonas_euryale.AAC.17
MPVLGAASCGRLHLGRCYESVSCRRRRGSMLTCRVASNSLTSLTRGVRLFLSGKAVTLPLALREETEETVLILQRVAIAKHSHARSAYQPEGSGI